MQNAFNCGINALSLNKRLNSERKHILKTINLKGLTVLLILIISFNLHANEAKKIVIDSLIDHTYNNYNDDPDAAFLISQKILQDSEEINYLDGQIEANLLLGNIQKRKGNAESWLAHLEKAEQLAIRSNDSKTIAKVFHHLAHYFKKNGQAKNALSNCFNAIKIQKEIKDLKGLGSSYLLLGNLNFNLPDTAILNYNQSFDIANQLNDTLGMAKAKGSIANVYLRRKGEFSKAIETFHECCELFESLDAKNALSISYYNLATAYRNKKDMANGVKYGLRSYELKVEVKDVPGQISTLEMIGLNYNGLNRYDDAINYFTKAKNLSLKNNWLIHLPSVYNNLGTAFVSINSDSAKYYLEKCITTAKKNNNTYFEGTGLSNLGSIYQSEKDFNTAEGFYLEAYNRLKESGNSNNINQVSIAIVEMYLEWLNSTDSPNELGVDLIRMEKILLSVEEFITKDQHFTLNTELLNAFITLYTLKEDQKSLNIYQSKLISIQDSTIEHSSINAANEWAEKLKTKDKEKEIVKLEAENELSNFRNKAYKFAIVGLVLFFTILGFLLYKFFKQIEAKKKQEEAQLFRSRLASNLHDEVGSVLASLALQSQMISLTATQQKPEMEDISKMSKKAMENLRDTVWAIDARKDKYENLLDRMIEYGEKNLGLKNIDLTVNKKNWIGGLRLDPDKRQNIFLIFKEAIANVLKYSDGNQVSLHLDQTEKLFKMIFHDNGTTFNKEKVSDGLGLSNMKMRAEQMGGIIRINSNNGFEISLEVKT